MRISKKLSSETARDYALRMINENIISLDLEPGSMVSENELSSEIGLSRTPVREALIELGKTQIVEILPQRGSRISLIDYDFVEESQFLRLVLENAVTELACGIVDNLDFAGVNEILKLQELCIQKGSPARLLELDDEFHAELFRLCNKMQTYRLMKSMTVHFDRVRVMSLMAIRDIKIVSDHKNIIQAIRDKKPSEARLLMTEHLSRYKIDKQAILEKYPDYFKR